MAMVRLGVHYLSYRLLCFAFVERWFVLPHSLVTTSFSGKVYDLDDLVEGGWDGQERWYSSPSRTSSCILELRSRDVLLRMLQKCSSAAFAVS